MQTHVRRSVADRVCRRLLCSPAAAARRSIRRKVDLFRRLCVSRWLLPLYYRGWITVTRHWLACLLNRLQSVLNATARSIAGLRRSEHITDALASIHWLRAPERVKFTLAVIVYRALHGTSPQYLSDRLQYVADLPTRRRGRLRSSTSSLLGVRPSRRVTVGDRSFTAAGPRLWNSLPADVQSAPSLTTFHQKPWAPAGFF